MNSLLRLFSDVPLQVVAQKNQTLKQKMFCYLNSVGKATIADFTQCVNLSTPKTITLVNEMLEDGLMKDLGKIDSTGGRRANLYSLPNDIAYFIGIDVRQYGINIGLLNCAKELVYVKEDISYTLENTQTALDKLIKEIKQFIKECGVSPVKIVSLAMGLSGRINYNSGYSYSYFNFREIPLAEILGEALKMKCFIENDSRAMAFGEYCKGNISPLKNMLFINMDYGLGLGIILNGKIFYGKSGYSGELGHTPMFNNDIICQCGKKGCLETEASGTGLVRLIKDKIHDGSDEELVKKVKTKNDIRIEDIISCANSGNLACVEAVGTVGEKIGRGVALLINIINPEVVVLGGPLSGAGELIRKPIVAALNKYALNLVCNDATVVVSKLGHRAGILGAGLMARNKILNECFID